MFIKDIQSAYNELITEENKTPEFTGNAQSLMETIKKKILEIFPNSYLTVSIDNGFGRPLIMIQFAIGQKEEWINRIIHNDSFHTIMSVALKNPEDLSKDLLLDLTLGGRAQYEFNREYQTEKIPFRKTTGGADKIIKAIVSYFQKMREVYTKIKDKLPANIQNK